MRYFQNVPLLAHVRLRRYAVLLFTLMLFSAELESYRLTFLLIDIFILLVFLLESSYNCFFSAGIRDAMLFKKLQQ